jgi:hypothetical protein
MPPAIHEDAAEGIEERNCLARHAVLYVSQCPTARGCPRAHLAGRDISTPLGIVGLKQRHGRALGKVPGKEARDTMSANPKMREKAGRLRVKLCSGAAAGEKFCHEEIEARVAAELPGISLGGY